MSQLNHPVWDEALRGFVLGRGVLYNPREERINSRYRFLGLVDDDEGDEDGWVSIMPCQNLNTYIGPNPWLETQGPGRLVFIPDDPDTTVKDDPMRGKWTEDDED